MSAYYKTCPNCRANLDPGERCDCEGQLSFLPKPAPKPLLNHNHKCLCPACTERRLENMRRRSENGGNAVCENR